jgi:hypothetical protein
LQRAAKAEIAESMELFSPALLCGMSIKFLFSTVNHPKPRGTEATNEWREESLL